MMRRIVLVGFSGLDTLNEMRQKLFKSIFGEEFDDKKHYGDDRITVYSLYRSGHFDTGVRDVRSYIDEGRLVVFEDLWTFENFASRLLEIEMEDAK